MELNKLKEALEGVDEVQCLELLDIKTHDILERFEDRIQSRVRYLIKELEMVQEPYEELNFD
jgi:hypothetical protein